MRQSILNFGQWLARIGYNEDDDDNIQIQKSLLVICSFPFMLAGLAWGIMYFFFDEPLAAAIPFSYGLISAVSIWNFRRTQRYAFFRFSQLLLILLLPFFLMISLGGFVNGSAVILWAIISPLGALLFDQPEKALRWFAAFLALIGLSALVQPYGREVNNLAPTVQTFFFVLNMFGVSSLVFLMVFYFVLQKNTFQARSESLLLNILPKETAAILKREQRTIADSYEEASVLFADMVGFTPLSARLAPVQMVELMNEIFVYFDSLLDKYGAEKIRTIGDNYMVATGVPRAHQTHAVALVQMALEMRDYIAEHTFMHGEQVHFRFGINSGPVIGGVIGNRKFVFDIWGDTVNVASRMESHGVAGSVQITEATYALIKDDFDCQDRGLMTVKGKGDMGVFLVLGPKA
jgi:guanylate cyclase